MKSEKEIEEELKGRHEFKIEIIIQSYDSLAFQVVKDKINSYIKSIQKSQEDQPKDIYVWINSFGSNIKKKVVEVHPKKTNSMPTS